MAENSTVEKREAPMLRAVSDVPRAPVERAPLSTVHPGRQRVRRRRHPVLWSFIVLAMLAAAGAAYWLDMPVTVAVVHPTRGPAVEAVYATGTVEATIMMPIAARVTARLVGIDVDEPATVKKGQVLARLEDQDLQSSLEQLRAQERFAQQDFERNAKLLQIGGVARAVYEKSKADWDAAKAAVAQAASVANFTKLVAPADGRIIRRDGEIGQLIPANQPVFWLSQRAPLRVAAEVDEEDIARVKIGQDVLIRADAFPGKIFQGRVQQITPKGDPVARSYRVRIELPEDTPLLIGMTAETNIVITRHDDALLLPASAVKNDAVWTVEDGKLAKRKVTVGITAPDRVEIAAGIGSNDTIVRDPVPALRAGEKAKPEGVRAP